MANERQPERPSPEELSRRQEVTTLGQLAAVAALLLPAIGAAVRVLAFSRQGIEGSLRLGVAAPVPELAALGAATFGIPAANFAFMLFLARLRLRWGKRWGIDTHRSASKEGSGARTTKVVVFVTISIIPALAILMFVAPAGIFLASSIGAFLGMVGFILVGRIEAKGAFKLGTAWPILLLLIGGSVLTVTTFVDELPTVTVSEYRFVPGTGLPDGVYYRLGESGDWVMLRPCAGSDKSTTISRRSDVLFERVRGRKRGMTSLFRVLTTDARLELGSDFACRLK